MQSGGVPASYTAAATFSLLLSFAWIAVMSQSVWSPLSDLRPKICGKVENNKVYCECGAEAREFTVVRSETAPSGL